MLDIVEIPLLRASPEAYQRENHVIDDGYYWRKVGRATWSDLEVALDHPGGSLWVNGYSTYGGSNDRVPEAIANSLTTSLVLIEPLGLVIWVGAPGADFNNPRRKVRARFTHNGLHYNVGVTDPVIEREYLARSNGEYPLATACLCVSLGELYEGYAYKLVAAVITPERTAAGR